MVETTVLANIPVGAFVSPDGNNATLNVQYDVTSSNSPTPGLVNVCSSFTTVSPPFVLTHNVAGNPVKSRGLCPNGDLSVPAGNLCYVPADADGNPNCLNPPGSPTITTVQCSVGGGNGAPGTNGGGQGAIDGETCTGYGPDPGAVDARAFNLYAYRNSGGCVGHDGATGECNQWSGQWVMATDDLPAAPRTTTRRPLFGGAYYRLHTSQDMLVPNTASYSLVLGGKTASNPACSQGSAVFVNGVLKQVGCPTLCTQQEMDDQIGCLVQASPCSLGIGGHNVEKSAALNVGGINDGGVTDAGTVLSAAAIKVGGFDPTASCQESAQYPLAHKVYLDTVVGLSGVSGQEGALLQCAQSAAVVDPLLLANGFTPLPDAGPNAINGGNPYCEDFDEQTVCGQSSNVNACAGQAVQTTCGNGIVEAYEECDPGIAEGPPCSTTCRLTYACPLGTGVHTFYQDSDGDGYGNPAVSIQLASCLAPPGYSADKEDCCDRDPLAFLRADTFHTGPDACGSYDYNCDGIVQGEYSAGSCSPIACAFISGFCELVGSCQGPNCEQQGATACISFSGGACGQAVSTDQQLCVISGGTCQPSEVSGLITQACE
jgi:cysteine-rich repeat protein